MITLMSATERFRDAIERVPARTLVIALVALHVALTAWQSWFIQINDDGVLYVRAARLLMQGQFADARAIYNWLGFPMVVAAFSKVTMLDAVTAAKLANFLASTGTFLLLLHMTWMQRPSKVTLYAAAVLIVGHYWWNEQRGAVTRDQFFYLFVVLSFYCLLLDGARPRLINKVGFVTSCACAYLFRAEAAALIVMVPALLVALGPHRRIIRLIAFAIWLAALGAIIVMVARQTGASDLTNFFTAPANRIAILRDQILAPFASRKALLAYSFLIAGLIVSGLLSALNPLAIALALWGAVRSAALRQSHFMRLWICYAVATFLVLSAQTYFSIVFEPRYGLAPGLLLTIPAALAATTLIPLDALRRGWAIVAVVVALAWLGYGFFGGIKLYDVSAFHVSAGQWLRENVQPGARSLSNNNQIAFYGDLAPKDADSDFFVRSVSGREDISRLRKWSNYDVVVLRLRQNQLDQVPALDAAIGKSPSKEFVNSRGDKILIYQPRKPAP